MSGERCWVILSQCYPEPWPPGFGLAISMSDISMAGNSKRPKLKTAAKNEKSVEENFLFYAGSSVELNEIQL